MGAVMKVLPPELIVIRPSVAPKSRSPGPSIRLLLPDAIRIAPLAMLRELLMLRSTVPSMRSELMLVAEDAV